MSIICIDCNHDMVEHDVDYAYRGYCTNDCDCPCKEKGLSYKETLNSLD